MNLFLIYTTLIENKMFENSSIERKRSLGQLLKFNLLSQFTRDFFQIRDIRCQINILFKFIWRSKHH